MVSKGGQTKERIVDCALRVASRDGLEGLTIGTLASELGMSKSGLFAHFRSKEQLQIQVLEAASERFNEIVLKPAFKAPRGEPRLRALFERWLVWASQKEMPGGCIFIAAGSELDDKPGPTRDYLVEKQRQLVATVARAAQLAVEEGHFRKDVDPLQFAFEIYGVVLAFHQALRLFQDPLAKDRAIQAAERILRSAKA